MVYAAEEIIAEYRRTESVKATAEACGCSEGTVVKHLVSAGMYSTPISSRIAELYGQGRSAKEIEAELHVSPSTVSKYLPYTKGTYLAPLDQKSPNARRIIKHRQKLKEEAMTKLAERRHEAGLSQRDLAELVGVSKRAIQSYEQKWQKPPKPMLILMAQVLKCKPEDLMEE